MEFDPLLKVSQKETICEIKRIIMRVKLYREDTIDDYAAAHANGKAHFSKWLKAIRKADWKEPADITKAVNGNLLGNGSDRVVFDIGGNGNNSFRIICTYIFNCKHSKHGQVRVNLNVNWIGTHEEYNRLSESDKLTVENY